jgi:hypothetical protein
MKNGLNRLAMAMSAGLMAVALSLPLAQAAQADGGGSLKSEAAEMDVTGASTPPASPAPAPTETLYGGVRQSQDARDASGAKLQGETAAAAPSDVYALAVKKLASGAELSSDEYRSLEFGTTGLETNRTFFQNIATVIAVYKGSPGEAAGIRVGDKMIDNTDDEKAKADPTKPLTGVTITKAGTTAHLTFLRHGTPVQIDIVRMNIEDISEKKYRQMWEQMVRNLGQREGTFIGGSVKELEHSPNIEPEPKASPVND